MLLIEYNAYRSDAKNASGKAKSDVSAILKKIGYRDLYRPSKFRWLRILQQIIGILFIPKKSIILIQYPSNLSIFYKLLSGLGKGKRIALIHDVESLRGSVSKESEVETLNSFDCIICHNESMSNYLRFNGVNKPMYNIQIFDYLLDSSVNINKNFDKFTIFFAGNLVKSKFLSKLAQIKDLKFNIYGSPFEGLTEITNQNNVSYKGAFSPEQLIANIEGGWGLVWDGDDLDECSGLSGKYLKYNNPHKVSMCIVSERPIIIWKKAAMAKYIEDNGIGIVVDSLFDLRNKISKISDKKYKEMLERVKREKEQLINGQNFLECLAECEKEIGIIRE